MIKMETKLRNLIKIAMIEKSKNKTSETESRYQTLKNILETSQKVAKDKKVDITDSMIIDAAKKEIKQLNELMEYCSPTDSKRIIEITIGVNTAKELLPIMASEEEIKTFVENHKNEANNIGAMMKLLKTEFGDGLDGKLASYIVKSIL